MNPKALTPVAAVVVGTQGLSLSFVFENFSGSLSLSLYFLHAPAGCLFSFTSSFLRSVCLFFIFFKKIFLSLFCSCLFVLRLLLFVNLCCDQPRLSLSLSLSLALLLSPSLPLSLPLFLFPSLVSFPPSRKRMLSSGSAADTSNKEDPDDSSELRSLSSFLTCIICLRG